jgi:hypothetical protein
MKKSRDFYLKEVSDAVEKKMDLHIPFCKNLSDDTVEGMLEVYDDYILAVWMSMGDTAFNRTGYRKITDDLFEHLTTLS